MSSTITVRRAQLEDLPRVAALAGALVRMHHAYDNARFMLVEPVEDGYQWFFSRELRRADALVLVATDGVEPDAAILGYAYGTLEPRNWNDLLDACGKLHDVFVDPAARGRGVGRSLVRAVCAAFRERGAPRVVLLSAARNQSAQAVFGALGFRPTMVEMTCELGE